MATVIYLGIAVTALSGCAWDLRDGRIPNAVTLGSAAAACCTHVLVAGPAGALFSAAGWLTGLVLFLPWFLARGLGGGDVKLLAAFGAWLGPLQAIRAALFAMLIGGLFALVLVLRQRRFRQTMRAVAGIGLAAVRGMPPAEPAGESGNRFAYAVPIAAGVGLALWLR